MDFRLEPKPLVPLYAVQQDRQPVYPRALGPVFIGNPYHAVSLSAPKANQADLTASAASQQSPAKGAAPKDSPQTFLQAPSYGTPRTAGISGTRVDLLA